MSARDPLKSYTKNELERITVLAARKQHAAEEALKALRRAVSLRIGYGFVAGLALATALSWWLLP